MVKFAGEEVEKMCKEFWFQDIEISKKNPFYGEEIGKCRFGHYNFHASIASEPEGGCKFFKKLKCLAILRSDWMIFDSFKS